MRQIEIGTGMAQYFVDEEGNVYYQYQSHFKEMARQLTLRGYCYIQVGGHRHLVHRLVATAFIPNPFSKRCVNHVDGNKTNNAVSNLEWVTHSENMQHAFDTGLYARRKGSKQNNAKLTEQVVEVIKSRLVAGDTGTSLAKKYGVAHGRIYDIKHGRAWTHVAAKRASVLETE